MLVFKRNYLFPLLFYVPKNGVGEVCAKYQILVYDADVKLGIQISNGDRGVYDGPTIYHSDVKGTKLTFICTISVFSNQLKNMDFFSTDSQLEQQLVGDFGKYFKNTDLSDVTLNVDSVSFPAHKFVLSARSCVFAAMFQHDMLENRKNAVDIPDIKSNVFEIVLNFIYTGDASGVNKFSGEILSAAEKYQLELLKVRCEDAMIEELSTKNAVKFFILAHLHSAKNLKASTMRFIDDSDSSWERFDWKPVQSSYPDLVFELYKDLFSNVNCKKKM